MIYVYLPLVFVIVVHVALIRRAWLDHKRVMRELDEAHRARMVEEALLYSRSRDD